MVRRVDSKLRHHCSSSSIGERGWRDGAQYIGAAAGAAAAAAAPAMLVAHGVRIGGAGALRRVQVQQPQQCTKHQEATKKKKRRRKRRLPMVIKPQPKHRKRADRAERCSSAKSLNPLYCICVCSFCATLRVVAVVLMVRGKLPSPLRLLRPVLRWE